MRTWASIVHATWTPAEQRRLYLELRVWWYCTVEDEFWEVWPYSLDEEYQLDRLAFRYERKAYA